eukprot:7322210-Alexandrium_andersonii.AAC.1
MEFESRLSVAACDMSGVAEVLASSVGCSRRCKPPPVQQAISVHPHVAVCTRGSTHKQLHARRAGTL